MRNGKLTTDQVLDVFTDELTTRGGQITDTFNDGSRLFARSVLPLSDNVRPGDKINGGIALKATDEQICVYPYSLRIVCRNGAIRAESVGSLVIEGLQSLAPHFILQSIRDGIDACCDPELFKDTIDRMRQTTVREIDNILNLLTMLGIFKAHPEVMSQILKLFFKEKEQTQFALGNAITAIARNTKDPQTRWDLEEFGGGLLAAITPNVPQDSARAAELIPVS
jgi:hypothetical protein